MLRPSAPDGTSSRSQRSTPVNGASRSPSGTKAACRIASMYRDDLRVGIDARRHRHLARRDPRARGAARPLRRSLVVVDAERKKESKVAAWAPRRIGGPYAKGRRQEVTFP